MVAGRDMELDAGAGALDGEVAEKAADAVVGMAV